MQVEGAFGYLSTIEKIMVCIAIHAFLTGTPFDVFSRAGIRLSVLLYRYFYFILV